MALLHVNIYVLPFSYSCASSLLPPPICTYLQVSLGSELYASSVQLLAPSTCLVFCSFHSPQPTLSLVLLEISSFKGSFPLDCHLVLAHGEFVGFYL